MLYLILGIAIGALLSPLWIKVGKAIAALVKLIWDKLVSLLSKTQ